MSTVGKVEERFFRMTPNSVIYKASDDKPHTITEAHLNYAKIRAALKAKDFAAVDTLIDLPKLITSNGLGQITVSDGNVFFAGEKLHNTLTKRILRAIDEGYDASPMIEFLQNLMANPSYRAVTELYDFLEHAEIPVTEDGHFLATKRVNTNYLDFHSGTVDHSVGKIPEMRRNMVDEDKNRTCSAGLHFCSMGYLPKYHPGEGRVVVLKINPRDVVAIPSDYAGKGRACRYEVIGEHFGKDTEDFLSRKGVFNSNDITALRKVAEVVDEPVTEEAVEEEAVELKREGLVPQAGSNGKFYVRDGRAYKEATLAVQLAAAVLYTFDVRKKHFVLYAPAQAGSNGKFYIRTGRAYTLVGKTVPDGAVLYTYDLTKKHFVRYEG